MTPGVESFGPYVIRLEGTAASGAITTLGPSTVSNVFETPACYLGGGCTGEDFPVDWGVIRTFDYSGALAPSDRVVDILINGTWGGNLGFNGTAPVELSLEGILVAECLIFDPCWNGAATVDWNGGAGFLLSDLGVDFSTPAVRALFEDGTAELSAIQNDLTSVNLSNLEVMVRVVPEPSRIAGIVAGVITLLGSKRASRREVVRRRARSHPAGSSPECLPRQSGRR